MKKFHLNVAINIKHQHAGTKANVDCKNILLSNGFTDLEIEFKKSAYRLPGNLAKLFYFLGRYYFQIPAGSLIVTQYPLLGINRFFNFYAKLLRSKKCTIACIIHDLDSLRYVREAKVAGEIKALNQYDIVISHNPAMSKWLSENGYAGKIVEIMLFDFLTDFKNAAIQTPDAKPKVIFAGNLARCAFLADIHLVKNVKFNLYGPGLSDTVTMTGNPDVDWQGSYPIDDIIYQLQGDYGLIWDGPSIYECSGDMGNYLNYNTPHKLSLYLTAGIPVIIPENAALAAFVKDRNIGIVTGNIAGLDLTLSRISPTEYQTMKQNAMLIGEQLKRGNYLGTALESVEKIWKGHETSN